jgi:hypothetical protein
MGRESQGSGDGAKITEIFEGGNIEYNYEGTIEFCGKFLASKVVEKENLKIPKKCKIKKDPKKDARQVEKRKAPWKYVFARQIIKDIKE